MYEGSPKEITEKLVELMGEFHKVVTCMFNIQNNCVCVCVCVYNKQFKDEFNVLPVLVASENKWNT